jgi:enoyl-CoA hydratase
VGGARAKELVFSGRFVGAEEALDLGLVDELVAPDGVYDAALVWANRFVGAPLVAIAAAKELIDAVPGAIPGAVPDVTEQTRRYGEVFAAGPGQLGCPA